jgi:hypothetical protein
MYDQFSETEFEYVRCALSYLLWKCAIFHKLLTNQPERTMYMKVIILSKSCAIFFPYLEQSFGIVLEMVDYPTPGVKKSAIVAVGNMCTCQCVFLPFHY